MVVTLQDLEEYLEVLGLPSNRVPSLLNYKKAYRKLLVNHPDKGGETLTFQKQTEAARNVFEYMTEHPEEVPGTEKHEEKEHLKMFEAKNNIKYNKESVVFDIKKDETQAWIETMENVLKTRGTKTEAKAQTSAQVVIRCEAWSIPWVSSQTKTSYGSITITVYPEPKHGQPRVMVQGRFYMAFVTLMLPSLAKSLHKQQDPQPALEDQIEKEAAEEEKQTEKASEEEESLRSSVRRLEGEVVVMKEELVRKLDADIALQRANQTELKSIKETLESLKLANTTEPSEVGLLKEVKTKVEEIDQKLETQINDVKNNYSRIENEIKLVKDHLKKSDIQNEIRAIKDNSDSSLRIFKAMSESLEKMSQHNVPNKQTEQEAPRNVEVTEIKKRKGIVFTSSIVKEMDKERFKEATNSEIEIVQTNYIEQNLSSESPELYLGKVLDEKLGGEPKYDFAIFSLGSTEITEADVTKDQADLFSQCLGDSGRLVTAAKATADKHDITVFLCDRPPRYDDSETPGSNCGLRTKLSRAANGHLIPLVESAAGVHLVDQAGLSRAPGRARQELYQEDGIHLTEKGVYGFTTNIILEMHSKFEDIRSLEVHSKKAATPSPSAKEDRLGGGAGQGSRRGRGQETSRENQSGATFRGAQGGAERANPRGGSFTAPPPGYGGGEYHGAGPGAGGGGRGFGGGRERGGGPPQGSGHYYQGPPSNYRGWWRENRRY